MAELLIQPGTKMQMAFDVPMGKTPDFNMASTFKEALDEAFFLVSAPMLAGKPLVFDENQKFLFQYSMGDQQFIIAAFPEGTEKKGIRTYWRMRQVMEQRTFFKRRDERIKVQFRVSYMRDYVDHRTWEEALTIDISAGGLAIYLNDYPDVGEALQVKMPAIELPGGTYTLTEQLGMVCWVREAPKGSLYRNFCGLQLRFADEQEREDIKEYIEHLREKYKI